MLRTFLSLKLDEDTGKKLKSLQNDVKEIIGYENARKIKWENTGNSHITLFFLGDTEEKTAEDIRREFHQKIENKTGEIKLHYSGITAFPNFKNPRVLVAKLDNEDGKIYSLNEVIVEILDSYGYRQDKPLRPHLTLGRVRRDENISFPDFRNIGFELFLNFKELIFNKSVLSSNGAEHFVIDRFTL
ncbi:MAG: RNA 2',3'-cyclic phosphodiesterase [Bacteroidetes bacterium]|nr:RNA 2',3'-cyclic phosphodiesterase [Bacteroidota bacterium]